MKKTLLSFAFSLACGLLWSAPVGAFCILPAGSCQQTGTGWPGATADFYAHGYAGSNTTFDDAFLAALGNWNGLSAFVYTATAASTNPCGGPNGTRGWQFAATVCGTSFGASDLAITSTVVPAGTPIGAIFDADIVFNTAYGWDVHSGSGGPLNFNCAWPFNIDCDFRRVATHELGHALGLAHDDRFAAAMHSVYTGMAEVPQTDDINGLIALYHRTLSVYSKLDGVSSSGVSMSLSPSDRNGIKYLVTPSTSSNYATYSLGASVLIAAAPSLGSGAQFSGWDYACQLANANNCTVVMNVDRGVTALYTSAPRYLLTVTGGGTGQGTVTGTGINCTISAGSASGTCSASYPSGATVSLTATPTGGSTFTTWGLSCAGAGSCSIPMTGARNVSASFAAPVNNYILTVTGGGTGQGTVTGTGINCTISAGSTYGTCSAPYPSGTPVSLTATPIGSTFSGWGPPCSGIGGCSVTMNAAKSVSASFTAPATNYTLTVLGSGTGQGTVTGTGGINCTISAGSASGTCSAPYPSGTPVSLTATPTAGSSFASWGDACSGAGGCSVTMNATKSVSASFTASGTCTTNPITLGQTVNDALSTTDCLSPLQPTAHYADRYSFSASSGQPFYALVTSTAFDTYLYLIGPDGKLIDQNDDGGLGGGYNSRIPPFSGVFFLPSTGTYRLEVTSYYANATGAYTLTTFGGLPTLTVGPSICTAPETGPPCTLTIGRTGSTASSLFVPYTLGGTAINGTDYQSLSGAVTIAAGASSATISVKPIDDSVAQGDRTVVVQLQANVAYTLGAANSSTVTIADNEISGPCTYALEPLDLTNTPAAGSTPSIAVTTPSGCPVQLSSPRPWVSFNSVERSGGATIVSLQIAPNTGGARDTLIVVADRMILITQLPFVPPVAVQLLVVAGGGAGGSYGSGNDAQGAGGGAGGVISQLAVSVAPQPYSIVVGSGGIGSAGNTGGDGENSSALGYTAIGGGGGGISTGCCGNDTGTAGHIGGSGGGGWSDGTSYGAGTPGQGNKGGIGDPNPYYLTGGGGGAGQIGGNAGAQTGGAGGNGVVSSISGSAVTYGGGGGAGSRTRAPSAGGTGGGGQGAAYNGGPNHGGAGTASTGGGGGGDFASQGNDGGSGIVIISAPIGAIGSTTGGTYTTGGGYDIWTFTSSGTWTPQGSGSVPDAPTIGTAIAGDASISVAFTPGAIGSGTLVNYTADCGGVANFGSNSPITVSGITNGTSYTCRVNVTTTVGTSSWSGNSNSVTPAAVPRAPTITSANATTFTVLSAGTFTVTLTGTPAPTLSQSGTLPSGVGFSTGTGVLSGTPALGTVGSYPITFTATNSGGSANQSFTLTVAKANQTISFTGPPNQNLGTTPIALTATATSSLLVTFSSLTTSVCAVSVSNVTMVAAGTCTIDANQAGNANYSPALQVTQSFLVLCDTGQPGDCDGDGIPNAVENAEGRYPLVKDNDVFGNARLFAMQQYRDFLGREGDAGGIAGWTNYINGGGTRAAVTEGFFGSNEFQGTGSPVVRLYFAYFLRIPDYGGLTFWINNFRSGNSLAAISNAFAGSAEFVNRYGALTNAQFVDLVYQNVLNRAADAGGKAFWLGQLNGGMPRGSMMIGFSESAEYLSTIFSETYVTMMYVGMLRRSPDSGGFAFWTNYLDQGNSGLALINGFLGAPEYRSRFLP